MTKKGESLKEDRLEEDNLPQAGSTSGGFDKDEEDEDDQDQDDDGEDDDDDDEDPKPRSFGTVAMASCEDSGLNDDGMTRPAFPTVFASMSVVSQVCGFNGDLMGSNYTDSDNPISVLHGVISGCYLVQYSM